VTWGAAEKEAAADIGEQAYIGFGHGHLGAVADYTQIGALRQAHAAAHNYAIHKGGVGFGVAVEQVVKAVFCGEEVF
jgi:hypothetical protein